VGIRCDDHALTSSTSGGRWVGIVRLWTKATEFSFYSVNILTSWDFLEKLITTQPIEKFTAVY
jgi:muconolactone delta-isomerase